MASRTVYPTSKEVSCPVCAKTMMLKNWKDHCQTKHSMILSEENLKKEYEKLKQATISSPSSSEAATDVLSTNTLFSMKNFSLIKHSPTTSSFNGNSNASIISSINNDDNINVSAIQNLDNNLIADVSSLSDCQTILPIEIESLDTESMINMFLLLYRDTLNKLSFSG
jgi:CHAT domain-containing protein